MDAHHNADDTNKSISTAYLEKANDDIMSIGEPQTPDDLSKYDGCYDSQALIGEMGVHGVRNIAFNQDTVFAVDIKRLIVRAFLRRTTEFPYISIYAKICDIEACEDSELIENIAYNVNDDSLLVLIENRDTQTSQLLSFSIGSIRAYRPYPAKKLVDCLDFDVPSNRAMSYDETRGVFIIYDLIDYEPKFELADTTIDIADFRFRSYQKNSYMMMFNSKNRNNKTMAASRGFLPNSVVPAFFYSKEDGKAKYNKAVELPLKVTKVAIKFLELLGERVLLSQWEEGGFLILDVSSDGIENFPMNIIRTSIESDVAPRYLSKTREFFTFNFWGTVQIYNLDGDLVRSLEDHCVGVSQDSSDPTNAFNLLSYVTSDEEIIISYCQSPVGYSINVSSLRTGKCLGKIANKVLDSEAITVLTYDEKTHEIITGNDAGFVRVWVNRFINPSHPS